MDNRVKKDCITITIQGLSEKEIKDLYCDYNEYCSISFSKGAIGDFMAEIVSNPLYSSLAANIIAPLVLKLGEKTWTHIKVSIQSPDGEYFPNLNRQNLLKVWEYIKSKCSKE